MPNYYNQYYPYTYQPQVQPQVQPQPQQIQNGGLVSVRNESEARNYPVAPGTSITFKDETAPYVYSKTMGFSQLDRPVFEKFKLIKEDMPAELTQTGQNEPSVSYATENMVNELKDEIGALWREIEGIKSQTKKPARKDTDA